MLALLALVEVAKKRREQNDDEEDDESKEDESDDDDQSGSDSCTSDDIDDDGVGKPAPKKSKKAKKAAAAKAAAALKPVSKKVTASKRGRECSGAEEKSKRATSKKCDESEESTWPARAVSSRKLTCLIFSAYMYSLSLARPSFLSAFGGAAFRRRCANYVRGEWSNKISLRCASRHQHRWTVPPLLLLY